MGHYIGIAVLILLGVSVYVGGGWYSYRYLSTYFDWPGWFIVLLSLGGCITGYFVWMDQFQHTSMMGENTRTWKNDPEHGVYIVPWKESDKLEIVEPREEAANGNHT